MKKQKKNKILVVEDERSLLKVLCDKLRREKFLVYEAMDGLRGLEEFKKHHPDIVVLDIVMPSMDGLTMLKKLREDKAGNTVPVLILSNLSDPSQINEATERGVVEYLVKSNWGLDDVVGKIRQTLAKFG